MSTARRTVITSSRTPRGGNTKLWAYGYPELSAFLGMREGTVRQAVARGTFDPSSLASVVAFRDARQASSHPKV